MKSFLSKQNFIRSKVVFFFFTQKEIKILMEVFRVYRETQDDSEWMIAVQESLLPVVLPGGRRYNDSEPVVAEEKFRSSASVETTEMFEDLRSPGKDKVRQTTHKIHT